MRNVVLIVLDTVRKDYFDKYAYRLNNVADVSFERCYAASTWTVPSHASMLTGQLPSSHGIHCHNVDFSNLSIRDTFFSNFPNHQIWGISANANANVTKGFDELFNNFTPVSFNRAGLLPNGISIDAFADNHDSISKYWKFLSDAAKQGELLPSIVNGAIVKMDDYFGRAPNIYRREDYGANKIIDNVDKLINDSPFFLYANFMEAHMPHHPIIEYNSSLFSVPPSWSSYEVDNWEYNNADNPEAYSEEISNIRDLYRASIDYLDRKVVEFMEQVEENTAEETTFVITADHGETLGYDYEGNVLGHDVNNHGESLLHVPCLVVNSPVEINTDGYFSHLDIGNLCVSLAKEEEPAIIRNRIASESIGLAAREHLTHIDDFKYWDRAERCVYDGELKYVWNTEGERFQCKAGEKKPHGFHSQISELPSFVDEIFTEEIETYKLRARENHTSRFDDVDDATRQQLEDLGYG